MGPFLPLMPTKRRRHSHLNQPAVAAGAGADVAGAVPVVRLDRAGQARVALVDSAVAEAGVAGAPRRTPRNSNRNKQAANPSRAPLRTRQRKLNHSQCLAAARSS